MMPTQGQEEVIPFTQDDVKNYLDLCIRYNRDQYFCGNQGYPVYYIDAFQSVRTTLFGETLAEETHEETKKGIEAGKALINRVPVPV